jgi:iron complex outermembrane receptor protein
VNYTSDADLKAEESQSFTLGAVWEITDGLSTTVDYWAFEITDAISRVNVQNELNKCEAGDSVACSAINLDPADAKKGDLSSLTSSLTNIGSQETSGIDWNISYRGDMFTVALDTTY